MFDGVIPGKDRSSEIINLPFLDLTCKEEEGVSVPFIYLKVKIKPPTRAMIQPGFPSYPVPLLPSWVGFHLAG